VARGPVLADHDATGGDGKPPAAWHGVARVHTQVHDDLIRHAGIRPNPQVRVSELEHEIDVFADEPAKHLRQAGDDRVEIERLHVRRLAPAEEQELPCQGRGPFGFAPKVMQPAAHVGAEVRLFLQHADSEDHRREDVVEVVRHAAGQPADRLQLLRLAQLLFEAALFGDVLLHSDEVGDCAVDVVEDGGDRGELPEQLAVFSTVVEFATPLSSGNDGAPQPGVLLARGVPALEHAGILALNLSERVAGDLGERRVHVFDPAAGVG
jgi:hypothetical protein